MTREAFCFHEAEKGGGIIPNVKVNFMLFAHKPSDLLAAGKGKM